ncbi:MAG TPA: universal stress protein, partial [Longimicrobium sp.]|uniref:universal stress protein n=1 Tax=Longimicrobium sp. TaxID=2029185 RepID=UPI002EDA7827
ARTLVAGVATLDGNDPVIRPAIELAARIGARLHLVHVCHPDEHTLLHQARAGAGPAGILERAVRERLRREAWAASPHPDIVCHAPWGRPDEVLPRLAADHHADLLLLAPTRRGRVSGFLLGTTAEHVLRATTVPVLVVHGEPALERVLLTTDLSASSLAAHREGLRLACLIASPGAAVRTLHAMPPAAPGETADTAEEQIAAALEELADVLPAHAVDGRVPRPCVRFGEPAYVIGHEARAWCADLLVLGTHARRGATRWLLGSVAETVLRHAPCTVLVIPPRRAPASGAVDGARPGDSAAPHGNPHLATA